MFKLDNKARNSELLYCFNKSIILVYSLTSVSLPFVKIYLRLTVNAMLQIMMYKYNLQHHNIHLFPQKQTFFPLLKFDYLKNIFLKKIEIGVKHKTKPNQLLKYCLVRRNISITFINLFKLKVRNVGFSLAKVFLFFYLILTLLKHTNKYKKHQVFSIQHILRYKSN